MIAFLVAQLQGLISAAYNFPKWSYYVIEF
jgi:hypothetical protein